LLLRMESLTKKEASFFGIHEDICHTNWHEPGYWDPTQENTKLWDATIEKFVRMYQEATTTLGRIDALVFTNKKITTIFEEIRGKPPASDDLLPITQFLLCKAYKKDLPITIGDIAVLDALCGLPEFGYENFTLQQFQAALTHLAGLKIQELKGSAKEGEGSSEMSDMSVNAR